MVIKQKSRFVLGKRPTRRLENPTIVEINFTVEGLLILRRKTIHC